LGFLSSSSDESSSACCSLSFLCLRSSSSFFCWRSSSSFFSFRRLRYVCFDWIAETASFVRVGETDVVVDCCGWIGIENLPSLRC
jgi:hypothetical protein